jgi:agmatine deiminase
MPIKINDNKYVSFQYNPDYLNPKKYQVLITTIKDLNFNISGELIYSDLIVDGGNIEKLNRTAFMVDKVFKENSNHTPEEIETEIKRLLDLDHLYFIPWDKKDLIGYIDGVLRLYDDKTLLINDYQQDSNRNNRNLKAYLNSLGYEVIEIPYNPYDNKTSLDATGIYINYLKINDNILLPTFNIKEDENALSLFKELYGKDHIYPINCMEIAKEGGLLNCISWF